MLKKKISDKTRYLASFYLRDYLTIIFGLILYTLGFVAFIMPNKIVTGGMTGVASIVNYKTGFPVWLFGLLMNLFLLSMAFRVVNREFVVKTIIGISLLTFTFSLGETYLLKYFIENPPLTDTLLSAIMGGLLAGAGLGFVYSVNGSTGGTDIVGFIVTKYFRISLARILLLVDVLIVVSSYFILDKTPQSLERTIMGLILLPVMWSVADMVISGAKQSVQIFIFSKKYEEIATHINTEIKRGCTVVDGIGWYSQTPQKVIIVIARRTEANTIFRLVDNIDDQAFVTQTTVMGVYGNGFDKLR